MIETRPLTVLALQHTATAGGAQRSFAALMRNLPEFGINPVAVVFGDGPLIGWLEASGVRHIVMQPPRLREIVRVTGLLHRLRRLIISEHCDAVFANMTKAHVYAALAAKLANRPEVWWQRGIPTQKAIERVAAFLPSAAVVASSDYALEVQRALRPAQRLRKIHPGVDVEGISGQTGSGASIRNQLGWHGKTIVGIVGRLERWKGQDVFLQAASIIAPAFPEVNFLVVGGTTHGFEGTYPEEVRAMPSRLGISDRVYFAGQQESALPWFDAMDVVVHASTSEAFGRVIVEGLALGKTVIATRLGGPCEIIEDGKSGILIPPQNAPALAAAIIGVLRDPDQMATFAVEARDRAYSFTEQRSAELLAQLLREVSAVAHPER